MNSDGSGNGDDEHPYFSQGGEDDAEETQQTASNETEDNGDDNHPLAIFTFPVGPMACNFVCIGDKETREALLIDPGGHPEVILREVATRGFYPTMILHTHAHFDHVGGTRMVSDETGAVVGLCGEDKVGAKALQFSKGGGMKPTCTTYSFSAFRAVGLPQPPSSLPLEPTFFYKHGDPIVLPKTGKIIGRVIHTPGHTPGSCCFYFDNGDQPVLCTGDTLFRRYIGRTDVLLADLSQLKLSILKRLYTLPPATAIIPGHGDLTTIEEERKGNFFVRHYTKEEEILKDAISAGAGGKGEERESKGRALREALKKKRGGGGNGGSSGGASGLGSAGSSTGVLGGSVGNHDPAGISPDDIPDSEDASGAAPIVEAIQTLSGFLRKVGPVVEVLHVPDAAAVLYNWTGATCCCGSDIQINVSGGNQEVLATL